MGGSMDSYIYYEYPACFVIDFNRIVTFRTCFNPWYGPIPETVFPCTST